MWRPENWKNPYRFTPQNNEYEVCFEAGADAMLEALYQETGHKPIWFGRADSGDILIYMTLPDEQK